MRKNSYIGKTLLGKYKIIKLIGQGGMDSSIFLAENISYEDNNYLSYKYKYAAIKIIEKNNKTSDDQWEKILDEGTTIGRLINKRNIVRLYDFAKINENTILIAMEYIDGSTLQRYILDNGAIPLNESIYIFEQILIGVKELHNNSNIIIHRDLKPENILISNDLSKIKIIDFGISSVLQNVKTKKNQMQILTNEESFYGTIPYLTPDVLNFSNKSRENYASLITKQFDFHPLGIIFYEMLTGKKPFYYEDDENPLLINLPQKYDTPPMKSIFRSFPNDIENIIIKLVASKESDYTFRYSNIEEILVDLNKYKKRIKNNQPEPKIIKKISNRNLQFAPKFNINNEIRKRQYKLHLIVYILFFVILLFLLILNILIISGLL